MLRFTGRVQMLDGSLVEFETGNAALAAWEEYAQRKGHPYGQGTPEKGTAGMLMQLVIAHHGLGVEQGFDGWRATVDGVELDEPVEVNPTIPLASIPSQSESA